MEFVRSHFPKWKNEQDDVWQSLWRGCLSEFFATGIFVFLGTGAVAASQDVVQQGTITIPSLTLISLAHGFAIMIMVYSVGEISGGHLNPSVTWALLFTSKISILRAVCYIISQLLGATVGSAILWSIHPQKLIFGLGCHGLNPSLTVAQGIWTEVVLTFIFVFVVFATAVSPFAGKMAPLSSGTGGEEEYGPGKLTPFALGMTILCCHTVGIPLTGASMNPARTFGPALVNHCWNHHYIYWIGPLFGSTLAALTCEMLFLSNPGDMGKVFRITRGTETSETGKVPTPGKRGMDSSEMMHVRLDDTDDPS